MAKSRKPSEGSEKKPKKLTFKQKLKIIKEWDKSQGKYIKRSMHGAIKGEKHHQGTGDIVSGNKTKVIIASTARPGIKREDNDEDKTNELT